MVKQLTFPERLRHGADVIRIARAARRELNGNKSGALDAISKAHFSTRFGRLWGELYRAKLLIRTNQALWNVAVAEIAKRVGEPQGVRYAGYFRWYGQYMLALSTCDEALEVEAVAQLDRQNSSRFLRRTLPYFPAPLAQR